MHGPNTTSDGNSPMYSGSTINTDGFRVKYENQPYFDSSGGDWLYFEKTESSTVYGDGGIAFGFRHAEDVEGTSNHVSLLLNGKRQALFNTAVDGNPTDARVHIGSPLKTGLKIKGEASGNRFNANRALISL